MSDLQGETVNFFETINEVIKDLDEEIEDLKSFLGDIKVALENYQKFLLEEFKKFE